MRRSCSILETESNNKIIKVSDNYAISSLYSYCYSILLYSDVCILTFHVLDGTDNQHKHELIKETNKMIILFTDITNGLYKFITNQKALKKFKNLIQSWIKY